MAPCQKPGVLRFVGRDLHTLPQAEGSAESFQRGRPKNIFPGEDLNSSATYRRSAERSRRRTYQPPQQASQNLLAEPFKYNNRKRNRQLWPPETPPRPSNQLFCAQPSPASCFWNLPGTFIEELTSNFRVETTGGVPRKVVCLLKNSSTHKLRDSENPIIIRRGAGRANA